jgi:nucleotide-binding universal stress UspA family protein
MTTAIRNVEHVATATSPPPVPGPIIVASDGGAPAATALAVAKMLRDRTGATIRVVSVVEPLAAVVPAPMLLTTPVPDSRVQQRHDLVREQVDRIVGRTPQVELEMEVGWPPEVLSTVVRDSGASFFVAGLIHHGRLERLARPETPLAVLRGARVPVLALPWGMVREPRCVVIGVDLSESSVVAARRAAPLLEHAEMVYLLHIDEPIAPLADLPIVQPDNEALIAESLQRVRDALVLPAGARVESRVLVGHPAFELADFAEYVQADLIVLGHQHRGMWGRMLHSSVAERTYRVATCGILIVPEPEPGSQETGRRSVTSERFVPESWPARLAEFTTRNMGRRVNLEILTFELGAQSASVNFPLLGVDYDPARGVVDIMLGDDKVDARHVTHSVPGVTSVERSSLEDGSDWALRVSHEGGDTLLTFVR